MFQVLFYKNTPDALNKSLPENYIVEYRALKKDETAKINWVVKQKGELLSLLEVQQTIKQAFDKDKEFAQKEERKTQAEADKQDKENKKAIRKKVRDIDLSVFTVPQRVELKKLIQFVLGELTE